VAGFVRAARQRRFLQFIVEQTLTGRGHELKEYALGVGVFDKAAAWDPRLDPIVRVTARELRLKVTAYYRAEGVRDPVVIRCRSGSYVPSFHRRLAGDDADAAEVRALYLKGLFHVDRQHRRGFARSIHLFRHALAKDPAHAAAAAALAKAYCAQCFYGVAAPRHAMPKARAAALRALAIDDGLADAHASLAFVRAGYEWRWHAAKEEFKRALELNPGLAATHRVYAMTYLAPQGLLEEAIEALHRALTLDPLSVMANVHLAQTLYMARRVEAAVRQARRTLDLDPHCGPAHLMLGLAYMQQSRHDAAAEAFRLVGALATDDTLLKGALGHCLGAAGRVRDARKVLAELMALSTRRYVPPLDIARVHIGLGDQDAAFAWLDKGFARRCSRLIWLNVHPMFDTLRADPRFHVLRRNVGLAP